MLFANLLFAVTPSRHVGWWGAFFITDNDPTNEASWVRGADDATQIAGSLRHACIRRGDGTVACLGSNESGQLGMGTRDDDRTHSYPVRVPGLDAIAEVAAADHSTCARSENGTVLCWGASLTGDANFTLQPTPVAGVAHATQLSMQGSTACVRRDDGAVLCWGDGRSGLLGASASSVSATPVAIDGLRDAAEIAVGAGFGCARMRDGAVKCWGGGFGATPGVVAGVHAAVQIAVPGANSPDPRAPAAASNEACALISNGHVLCWSNQSPAVDQASADASGSPAARPPIVQIAMGPGSIVAAWPASGTGEYWNVSEPQHRHAIVVGSEPSHTSAPPITVMASLPAFTPPPAGSDADAAFRAYASAYSSALGGWSIVDWGTVPLAPRGAPDHFATLCEPTDLLNPDLSEQVAFLVEHAGRAYVFLWRPNGRFAPCDPSEGHDDRPAVNLPWRVSRSHELVGEWGLSGERDYDHIGIRRGRLVRFRWERVAGESHGGAAHGNTNDPVPLAVGPDGWLPDPIGAGGQ